MSKRKKQDKVQIEANLDPVAPENSRNVSRVAGQGETTGDSRYDNLDAHEIEMEFNRLQEELDHRSIDIAQASKTIREALPHLSNMQALLSQRGANRQKVLGDAGVPKWTVFAQECGAKMGYSARQLQNLIREFRGRTTARQTQTVRTPNCKKMLESLLDLLEHFGGHLPVTVTSHCRTTREALAGKIESRDWRKRISALDLALVPSTAVAGSTHIQ
jgi:hypothetical protein